MCATLIPKQLLRECSLPRSCRRSFTSQCLQLNQALAAHFRGRWQAENNIIRGKPSVGSECKPEIPIAPINKVSQGTFACQAANPDEKPPIVLIHGAGHGAWCWQVKGISKCSSNQSMCCSGNSAEGSLEQAEDVHLQVSCSSAGELHPILDRERLQLLCHRPAYPAW